MTAQPSSYVPDTGDIVWLEFNPQAGHEQAGRRPALVLTSARYNSKTGLMLCCPLTTKIKNYPFEVTIAIDGVENAILSDQVKSLDWKARKARKKATIPPHALADVRAKIKTLLEIS